MKKGGIREVNSFISVANSNQTSTSRNTADRRRSSIQREGAAKYEPSKIEKTAGKILTSSNVPSSSSRSVSFNKTRKNDVSRKNIAPGNDPSARQMQASRNISLSRTNPISKQSDLLLARRPSFSNPPSSGVKSKLIHENTSKISSTSKTPKIDTPVRKNSVPFVPKTEIVEQSIKNDTKTELEKLGIDEDYEYEDDFEDYESDFESLSESQNSSSDVDDEVETTTKVLIEEEKKMDSGSYDLTNIRQLQKQKNHLEVIKEALNKENTIVQQSVNSSSIQTTSFNSDSQRNSENTDILLDFNTRSVENFTSAKKRQQNSKIAQKIASRGEKLLQMITLDTMNFSLFEMAPTAYDIFMRSYARKNTTQAFTQTNEDNVSFEIQTEDIINEAKWTQYPVNITKEILEVEHNLSEVLLGVGAENTVLENVQQLPLKMNSQKLINFMKCVGEEMIALLEEKQFKSDLTEETFVSKNTDISECVSSLRIESLPFLSKRPILSLVYDPHNNARILTIHGLEINSDENQRYFYLCIWNTHQFWKPKIVLKSHNRVTSCCFIGYDSSLVVAGHEDGSICVWNLRESFTYSEKLSLINSDINLQYPSVNTAEMRENNTTHRSKVISVESTKSNNLDFKSQNEIKFEKIFSIDENNILIIWSLSPGSKFKVTPWCKINFFASDIFDISQKLPKILFQTTCLKVVSESKILVGTDLGSIIEYNLFMKSHKIHQKYFSKSNPEKSRVTCLEICPYNHLYFVAGYSNGNVNLFNSSYTEPISIIENYSPFSSAINSVQWFWNKLDHVLVLDFNFLFSIYRFHQDYYSLICRCKTDGVYSVQISSSNLESSHNTHYFAMLIGNEIQIHRLKLDENWRS